MKRSITLLSIFLASRQNHNQVLGFSMVAPPVSTKIKNHAPLTNTFYPPNPSILEEPNDDDFSRTMGALSTTMPALSSPLFTSLDQKQKRDSIINGHDELGTTITKKIRIKNKSILELKVKLVALIMLSFIILEEFQKSILERKALKNKEDIVQHFWNTKQYDAFWELNKTNYQVQCIQNNLQYVWDAAGKAIMDKKVDFRLGYNNNEVVKVDLFPLFLPK